MKLLNFFVFLAFTMLLSSCAILGSKESKIKEKNNTFTIITNVEGAKIEVLKNPAREKFIPTNQKSKDGFYSVNTFKNPKLFRTKLLISKENYTPDTVVIRKAPRPGVVICDICVFTPFSLIIDIWSPNFYKISSGSKVKTVQLQLSQSFMDKEFIKIQKSNSTQPLADYLNHYPNSNKNNLVRMKIDSIEFQNAIMKKSELAIEDFIKSHPNSVYLTQAKKTKDKFELSRLSYEKLILTDSVEEHLSYLSNFPESIYLFEVTKRLVELAYNRALSSNTLQDYLAFNENYLLKFQKDLDNDMVKTKTGQITKLIDNAIINTYKNTTTDELDYNFSVWLKAEEISEKYRNLSDLSASKEHLNKANLMIGDKILEGLSHLKDGASQKLFLDNFRKKYDLLIDDKYKVSKFPPIRSPLILMAFDKVTSFTGQLRLYDYSYTMERLFQKSVEGSYSLENDVFYPLRTYDYQGINYNNSNADGEELKLFDGKIVSTKLFLNNDLLCSAEFVEDNVSKISFYLSGKLVRENYYTEGLEKSNGNYTYDNKNRLKYYYEFENGKNLTLLALDLKLNELEKKINTGNIPNITYIYDSKEFQDYYPIPQQKRKMQLIYKAFCELCKKNDIFLALEYSSLIDKEWLSPKEIANYDKLYVLNQNKISEYRREESNKRETVENDSNSYKTIKSSFKFCFKNYEGKYVLTVINYTDETNFATLQQYNNLGNLEKTVVGEYYLRDEGLFGPAEFLTFQPTGVNSGSPSSKFLVVRTGYGTIQSLKDSEERIWNICN